MNFLSTKKKNIYIYIYIYRERERERERTNQFGQLSSEENDTKILFSKSFFFFLGKGVFVL